MMKKNRFQRWVVITFGVVLLLGLSVNALASAHHMFEDEAAAWNDRNGADRMIGPSRWDGSNEPATWSTQYQYVLTELPLQGQMQDHIPWSDTYWPSNRAGIAARWNWAGFNGFKYGLFSESQIRAMVPGDLARLSPAEKYDIFLGRFDYPTVTMVRGGTSPHAEYWSGICHGWSPAALNHAEPAPVTVTGPSGVAVPFGSADVKALLDYYYADNAKATTFMGLKCQAGEGGNIFRRIGSAFLRNSAACQDVNAGALHVIFGNELGLRHQGFVADVDRWREVWNQPVYGYSSTITGYQRPSSDAASGTVQEAVIHSEMYYADEIDPKWDPVVGTPAFKQGVEKYDYTVELDAAGRIIGGQWLSANRPDFLWTAARLEFTGFFSGIQAIYHAKVKP
ncbi:hypothetical protein WDW37_15340 [Bdellovibrionota bacterium FG-1]